jgi:hypothetical protein
MIPIHQWTYDGSEVLLLRRVGPDGLSHGGFTGWRDLAVGETLTCPDWNPAPQCGGGLHGWPWGLAIGAGTDWSLLDDTWLVFGAAPTDVAAIDPTKAKAREIILRYRGAFARACAVVAAGRAAWIRAAGSPAATTGWESPAATAGVRSPAATAGVRSPAATAGGESPAATAGGESPAATTGWESPAATAGVRSPATTAGRESPAATAGVRSPAATAGARSDAVALGANSHASAGPQALALSYTRARAGIGGILVLPFRHPDATLDVCIGRVGHDGIAADTWYHVVDGRLQAVREGE